MPLAGLYEFVGHGRIGWGGYVPGVRGHRMRRRLLVVLAVAAMVATMAAAVAPASGATPAYRHLDPGGPARYREKVPVNLVLVGYERDQVHAASLLAGLPSSSQPLVRIPQVYYGITDLLGISYTYDYDLTYADAAYERRFFSTLSRLARPAPLTQYQRQYNDQQGNVLEVTDNHAIDAPTVERWLARHPPAGVDTRRDTIFFVNWYGRPDFKFHVYTKTGEPDPDTGFDHGQLDSRKLIAWGGTTPDDEESGLGAVARVWFYDLSAGPESWTDNWNVDDADLDGDGEADYRMPPIWEYRAGGNRAPEALTGDLAKVARYVGIDLLFTSSPLYRPDLTPPDLPHTVNIDANTYEGWPGVDASSRYITPRLLLEELSELQPTTRFSYDNQDLPFTGKALECYVQWLQDVPCYPDLDYPGFANLFVFNALNLERTQDDAGRVDYELPNFNYVTTDDLGGSLLGYADDNWRTGTQSLVFNFLVPSDVEAGYGLTATMIHENGHHLAMSHAHDGYDSETGVDFVPSGPFYFAWSGDEGNSVMGYLSVNYDFSQFDRDNMSRYLAAAFARNANRVAADILADPDRGVAADELAAADRLLGASARAFSGHRYLAAAFLAKGAYDLVRRGARQAGVPVVGSTDGWEVEGATGGAGVAAAKVADGILVDRRGPDSHLRRR